MISAKLAKKLVGKEFVVFLDKKTGAAEWFQLVRRKSRTIKPVMAFDLLETHIVSSYKKLPSKLKLSVRGKVVEELPPRLVKQVMDVYRLNYPIRITPKQLTFKGDNNWTRYKFEKEIKAGPTPAWDEFTFRLSDPDLLEAWIWSIFELQHRGRQALWLHGQGLEGKSEVLKVLFQALGDIAMSINDTQASSRFVLGSIHQKRLLIYPDCCEPTWARSEVFRQVTGGDVVPVEKKFKDSIATQAYARIAVASNKYPDINQIIADTSRLLVIEVAGTEKKDVGWSERLAKELPCFLYRCRQKYQILCKDNFEIRREAAATVAPVCVASTLSGPFKNYAPVVCSRKPTMTLTMLSSLLAVYGTDILSRWGCVYSDWIALGVFVTLNAIKVTW